MQRLVWLFLLQVYRCCRRLSPGLPGGEGPAAGALQARPVLR